MYNSNPVNYNNYSSSVILQENDNFIKCFEFFPILLYNCSTFKKLYNVFYKCCHSEIFGKNYPDSKMEPPIC